MAAAATAAAVADAVVVASDDDDDEESDDDDADADDENDDEDDDDDDDDDDDESAAAAAPTCRIASDVGVTEIKPLLQCSPHAVAALCSVSSCMMVDVTVLLTSAKHSWHSGGIEGDDDAMSCSDVMMKGDSAGDDDDSMRCA